MTDREILYNRIRNLLNKTVENGSTEAEAEAAMAAAQRIMGEHDIAVAEAFESGGISIEFNQESIDIGKRIPGYVADVAEVIDEVFGVQVVMMTLRFRGTNRIAENQAIIFGESSKLESARWGFVYLCGVFKDLWTRYRIARKWASQVAGEADSYYLGLRDGFLRKLAESKASQDQLKIGSANALARVDQCLKDSFAAAFPGVKMVKRPVRGSAETYLGGVRDGRSINLARPLASPGQPDAPKSATRSLPAPGK